MLDNPAVYASTMARNHLSMHQIKKVLRLKYDLNLSVRQIARATSMARSTVADYLARAHQAQLPWPLPDSMDQPSLWEKLFAEQLSSRSSESAPACRPIPIGPPFTRSCDARM